MRGLNSKLRGQLRPRGARARRRAPKVQITKPCRRRSGAGLEWLKPCRRRSGAGLEWLKPCRRRSGAGLEWLKPCRRRSGAGLEWLKPCRGRLGAVRETVEARGSRSRELDMTSHAHDIAGGPSPPEGRDGRRRRSAEEEKWIDPPRTRHDLPCSCRSNLPVDWPAPLLWPSPSLWPLAGAPRRPPRAGRLRAGRRPRAARRAPAHPDRAARRPLPPSQRRPRPARRCRPHPPASAERAARAAASKRRPSAIPSTLPRLKRDVRAISIPTDGA